MNNEEVIVTAFSGEGYKQYGKRMLDSYDSPFPLIVYMNEIESNLVKHNNVNAYYSQNDISGLRIFLDAWRGNKEVAGMVPNDKWKPKERDRGYNYKFDIIKFCRMIYVMLDAAEMLYRTGTQRMIWLDGDSVIRRRLPDDLFDRVMPFGSDYAYLGREPKHTETGFLAFRLPEVLPILRTWADFCVGSNFMDESEWHSAFLFDRAKERHPEIRGHNLTPGGSGHVIHKCEVGTYIDHLKGNRKNKGRSPEAR